MAESRKRPTTIAEMAACLARFFTRESIGLGLGFQPRASDVFIATYPKCGTTWLQQIAHGLRTRGDMDFDEITSVVPWLEASHDLGMDPTAEQVATPRLFKSHLTWEQIPKGGKYLCVIRDPGDVLVSQHHFWEGWFFEPGAISLADSARNFFMPAQLPIRYWNHVISWWRQKDNPLVLLLCYEDMHRDLPQTVRRIAEFIGCPADEQLLGIVLRQSSIEFMRAHQRQFDDHLVRNARDEVAGLPPGGDSAKVRKGGVGDHRTELPADIRRELEQLWQAEITPLFGFPDYQAMREELQTA